MTEHSLKAFSTIEYCLQPNQTIPIDLLDMFAVTIGLLVVGFVIVASLYDRYLRNLSMNKNKSLWEYYKSSPANKSDLI